MSIEWMNWIHDHQYWLQPRVDKMYDPSVPTSERAAIADVHAMLAVASPVKPYILSDPKNW